MLASAALELARTCTLIVAAKGQKIVRLDLKKYRAADDELQGLIVGPSGKLRAPAIRTGKTLIVGFLDAMYREEIG